MPTENHKGCYGAMFPDTLHAPLHEPVRGKVFAYHLLPARGMVRSDREVLVDMKSWDECIQCQEFEHCYKFSLGRLLLEAAIADK